ncbi:hypothetical protein LCGC14_2780080 [marine sediment metagenome]|uniref:Uncharacterized protein n=1 Tax=marine sediment metagenome TaxID=412755 RepID=A0A0F8YTH9_9ZZZZ
MSLLSPVKRLLFRLSMGLMPRCACGEQVTQVRRVTSMGHVIGLLFSCDEHVVIVENGRLWVVQIEDGKDAAEAEVCLTF